MTIALIIITSLISVMAFKNQSLSYNMQFNASKVYHNKEWHRLLTHAFIHANYEHLFINMIVLFSFGTAIERYFGILFAEKGRLFFILLYVGGILFSNIYSLFTQRDNYYYNAVGASGAVSAVIFTSILLAPWNKLYFFMILPIPGIVFGIGYLIYSYYMAKKNVDNIGHDAHFLGAVFGLVFPIVLKPSLFVDFVDKLFLVY
ncbi:rhomboid family intramembrane serine protease [Puteibacter caeruleilacunae]|nr:rhomboid family intramembrane serine protease [Puteibacter caeruleilacunae]